MRRSEAARYARWSAAVALLLACVTAGVYVKRGWQRHTEQKKAPPPTPVGVEKQSSGLTFSKMDGPRKIFTVEASKSTDFKDQQASLLENVQVTIFGKNSDRHDVIHTESCQYGKGKGAIVCTGAVQIDLQSAADAEKAAKNPQLAAQIVHVETRGVTFDNGSGDAKTDQPVTFTFPNGSGNGVGAIYNSAEGTLRLLREVKLNLQPALNKTRPQKTAVAGARAEAEPPKEVHVTGTALDFGRDAKVLHIAGPAEADSDTARLTAGEFTLELDSAFRARRLLASAPPDGKQPEITSQRGEDALVIDANQLTAQFAPEGWVARLDGTGSVRGARRGPREADEFHGDAAALDMWPRVNQAKELNLSGGVFLKTRVAKTGDERVLQTVALRMQFREGDKNRSGGPSSTETLTAGSMEWTDASPQPAGPSARTKLQADKLQLAFGDDRKPQELVATGNVQTERAVVGRPLQTATAKSGVAELLPSGGWSRMELQDEVKLREAERSAQADHVNFDHAAQTALLTGHAVARDAATETRAPRILFYSNSGDIRAEGGVRSTDFSPNGGSAQFAPVPANITSDTMQGNSKGGRALYSGHARLWQGDSVLEADSIELLRETKVLNAAGRVRGVFPQTAAPAQTSISQGSVAEAQAGASPTPGKKAVLWHVASGTLTYNDASSTAHLEKNVVVQSPDERIRAPEMDLFFTRGSQAAPSGASGSSANSSGPQQISRAVGSNGVVVDQGGRRAVANRGEYTAADGKFVMTGGTPTLYDGSEGTTTGRQLTFFLADDTIIVDSENGSRTLTKHRVNN